MRQYRFTVHALFEMKRRGLSEELVRSIVSAPEQEHEVRIGRVVMQSRVKMGGRLGTYLVRVYVDTDRDPPEIVTVYRTSKIAKYWRELQ